VSTELLTKLGQKLDERQHVLSLLDAYMEGKQPLTYLAPAAREALGGRLQQVAVNIPRVVVASVSERLRVTGFVRDEPRIVPPRGRMPRTSAISSGRDSPSSGPRQPSR